MTDLPAFVLDSFALLAYLQDEPAALRIEKELENAGKEKCRLFLSIINLGELLYIIERKPGVARAQETLALIRELPIEIVPAEEKTVLAAAHLKANHAISYADSFAVAVTVEKNATLVTGDPEFQSVENVIAVEWLENAKG